MESVKILDQPRASLVSEFQMKEKDDRIGIANTKTVLSHRNAGGWVA